MVKIPPMPPHVLKAYEVWRTNHNLNKTARIVGKAPSTIWKWMKKYQWEEIERQRLEEALNAEKYEIERVRDEQMKIVRGIIISAVRSLAEGELKVRTIDELLRVLEYQRELIGDTKDKDSEEVKETKAALAELIKEIEKRRKVIALAEARKKKEAEAKRKQAGEDG